MEKTRRTLRCLFAKGMPKLLQTRWIQKYKYVLNSFLIRSSDLKNRRPVSIVLETTFQRACVQALRGVL